jgi:hypothetical protein
MVCTQSKECHHNKNVFNIFLVREILPKRTISNNAPEEVSYNPRIPVTGQRVRPCIQDGTTENET